MNNATDLVAPLVALAEAGIPSDVQELLVQGDPMRGIAPGALEKAIRATLAHDPAGTPHDRLWVWFADNGNIRKWQREPFEGGVAYISSAIPGEVAELEPLNDLARKTNLFIDNAATASQTDFDETTREAIELNVIAPLILALSERDATIAAKDAELAVREKEIERLTKALEKKHRAFIIASNQAMSNGSAAHKAETERDELRKESARFASQNLMLQGMVAQSEVALTCAESSLAEREAEMGRGWQPIETAPVNGPDFVAWVVDIIDEYDEDDRIVVRGKKVGRAVIAQCVSFTGEGRGEVVEIPWKFVQGRQYTHWMPLPAAPATRTGGQE